MQKNPIITVILATKNEEHNIKRCIDSILEQSLPSDLFRIRLVDNNSSDRTREIASQKIKFVHNLHEVVDFKQVKNARGAQVNWGVKNALGRIIFIPDTDMTFSKNLFKEVVELIDKKGMDALYVPEVIVRRGLLGKIRNFERSFYNETCIDAIRFVKKDIFLSVGGFDEKHIVFGPDDWDLDKMIRKKTNKIAITKNKLYHHEENQTLKEYLLKKFKYTKTFDLYIKKWGKDDPDIKKQFGFYYRYIGVFIENGKWKKIVKNPKLSFGMFSLRFLIGLIYFYHKLFFRK